MTGWSSWADRELERVRRSNQWREPRDLDARGPRGVLADGSTEVVSYASNDYLGLTAHPEVIAAAHDALDRWGSGSGAARLLVGSRPVHRELEQELAAWKAAESATLFSTGYAANLGVLATFGGPGVRICSDELNHASIIDGCRLSGAEVRVYRHLDLDHLSEQLRGADRAIVVTDGVFSMDGDVAPLADLADLCRVAGALLVVDEAHLVFDRPGGDVSFDGLRVGTLSKTLGALGGFVAGPQRYTDLLVNRARPYIFTTASTPADAAAALAAVRIVRSPEGDQLRARLRGIVDVLAPGHPSPIVPVVVGDEIRALEASASLLHQGMLVPAVRPPTVAPGTSRLRVALSAAHRVDEVERLAAALDQLSLGEAVARS